MSTELFLYCDNTIVDEFRCRAKNLHVVERWQVDEFNILCILSSLYAVDIDEQKTVTCQKKMMRAVIEIHKEKVGRYPSDNFLLLLLDIVQCNIRAVDCFNNPETRFIKWEVPLPLTFQKKDFPFINLT